MPRPEGLHRGFLGGKSTGKVDGRQVPPRAVRDLLLREDALEEAVAEAFDGVGDPIDVGDVESQTDDGGHI